MVDFVTAHFHNPVEGREQDLSDVLRGPHLEALAHLRGFRGVQRFEVAEHQLLPEIAQPWRYVTLYDFDIDQPEIDIPAIAPLLATIRDAGLLAANGTERIYSYQMYSPWKYSSNYRPGPLSHLMLLLANIMPGREVEYHKWYDEQHSVEVSEAVGYVGMRRGGLSPVQVPPVYYCPGSQLILGALQCHDLAFTVKDFIDRANGVSPSGIAWGTRSTAASLARTVHLYTSVDGPFGGLVRE